MKTTLVFEHRPILPCAYSFSTSTFTACLGCGTAHETRFCNGDTVPSWQLCPHHKIMNKMTELKYDGEMLDFLQKSVYDGSIPKPKPPPKPRTEYAAKPASSALALSIQHRTSSDTGIERQSMVHHVLNSDSSQHARALRIQAKEVLWPVPTTSYVHAATCMHNPSAKFSTRPVGSESPSIKLLTTSSAIVRYDNKHAKTLTRLEEEYIYRAELGDFNVQVKAKITKMKRELKANRLVKAVFFKRCNGSYVNCLGWEWSDDYDSDSESQCDESGEDGTDEDDINNNNNHHQNNGNNSSTLSGYKADIETGPPTSNTKHNKQQKRKDQPDPATALQPPHTNNKGKISNSNNNGANKGKTPTPPPQDSIKSARRMAPTIPYERLRAREVLVQTSASHSPKDLIITAWAWNQQARK